MFHRPVKETDGKEKLSGPAKFDLYLSQIYSTASSINLNDILGKTVNSVLSQITSFKCKS